MFIKSVSQNLSLSSLNQESKSSLELTFRSKNTNDFYRNVFLNHQKLMIMHKRDFVTVDFTAQMQYFMVRVANFEPLYLKQFWVKIQSFFAHWTGNFLNFSKLTQFSVSYTHLTLPTIYSV